ncbi:MAG: hypothetical protein U9O98_01700 [Asgard group archaeon]|nr:hypothetical protein [Asgard group archaeon]
MSENSFPSSKKRFALTETSDTCYKDKEDYLNWYRLDNAATVFSLVSSKRTPCLFRLSATLDAPIKIKELQLALENIIPRFPYYKVHVRRGLFWNFLEANEGIPVVIKDSKYPCKKMPIPKKGIFPFRVRAFSHRIAVEFHHCLTDGTGALTFLQALITEYYKLLNVEIVDWGEIFRPHQEPELEEYEDAYKKNYRPGTPNPPDKTRAFHLPFKLEPKGVYNLITGVLSVKDILNITRSKGVTITEYLVAVYIDALQDIMYQIPERKRKKYLKPIRIMVPVDLRRIYESKTMRNFSLFITPGIDPRLGRYSFKDILKKVHHYMQVEVDDKLINQQIARNVRGELNPLVRIAPSFIKKLFGKIIFRRKGVLTYSGVLTNLGKVTMPKEIYNRISRFEFFPAPQSVTKTGCGVISYKDNLVINFGRTIKETHLEKLFFRKLVQEGLSVKIESNI